ncbi:MAG TPA: hypothetical protein VMD97_06520 [Candidatus Aquilonibacter sp.]|nr:hypothetical protein [Candidatus Aquilonibacter sp.]
MNYRLPKLFAEKLGGGGGGTGSVPVTVLGDGVEIRTVDDVCCAWAEALPRQASANVATNPKAMVRMYL